MVNRRWYERRFTYDVDRFTVWALYPDSLVAAWPENAHRAIASGAFLIAQGRPPGGVGRFETRTLRRHLPIGLNYH